MNAKQFDEQFANSKPFQFFSGLGLVIFSSLMFMSWQRALSEVETANATPGAMAAAVSSTTPETPAIGQPISMESPSETPIAAAEVPETNSMAIASVPEIIDATELQELKAKLSKQIEQNWTEVPTFSSHLIYQVQVTSDGAIAAYQEVNLPAKDYVNQTPLVQLVQLSNDSINHSAMNRSTEMTQKSVTKFLVMFTPGGLLEVSPWLSQES